MRRAENAIEKTGARGVPTPRGRPADASEHVTVDVTIFARFFAKRLCASDRRHHVEKIRTRKKIVTSTATCSVATVGASERAAERGASAGEPSTRRRRNIFFSGSFFLRRFDCAKSVQASEKVPRARFRRPTPRGRPDASGPSRRLGAAPGRRLGARNGRRNDF